MKTHLNQIITVVGFFSLSIGATLAISWGVANVFIDKDQSKKTPKNITIPQANTAKNIQRSFKLLIPNIK